MLNTIAPKITTYPSYNSLQKSRPVEQVNHQAVYQRVPFNAQHAVYLKGNVLFGSKKLSSSFQAADRICKSLRLSLEDITKETLDPLALDSKAYQDILQDVIAGIMLMQQIEHDEFHEQHSLSKKQISAYARTQLYQIKETDHYLVIKNGKNVVGCAYIIENPDLKKPDLVWEYAALYLTENFRGKGLGKAITQGIIQEARQKNISRIWALVRKNNQLVIQLNQKAGFQIEGEDGPNNWKMTLNLKPL